MVLEHPNRDLLLRIIDAQPGAHFRNLATESKLGVGNTRHHLDVLLSAGLITQRRNGHRLHNFIAKGFNEKTWRTQAALSDPKSNRLARLVDLLGTPRQQDVVMGAQSRWSWSRSVTQDRLRRLVNMGVLERLGSGGRYRLA